MVFQTKTLFPAAFKLPTHQQMVEWLYQRDQMLGLQSSTETLASVSEDELIYYQEEAQEMLRLPITEWDPEVAIRLQQLDQLPN